MLVLGVASAPRQDRRTRSIRSRTHSRKQCARRTHLASGPAQPGQRQRSRNNGGSGGNRSAAPQQRRRSRGADDQGVIPVLARAAREVEAAVQKGPRKPANRARFQVAALLLREERARVKTDPALSDAERANEQKRLDGLAGILAKTAARDTSLIAL